MGRDFLWCIVPWRFTVKQQRIMVCNATKLEKLKNFLLILASAIVLYWVKAIS